MWWYILVFVTGFFSAFGAVGTIGAYAFKNPEILAPIARKMMRAMMAAQTGKKS